jgi:hypothetical protein
MPAATTAAPTTAPVHAAAATTTTLRVGGAGDARQRNRCDECKH